MAEFTITLRGLPPHTHAALRSMLTLLAPVLGTRWRVANQMPADVVLLPATAFARLTRNATTDELPLLLALAEDDIRPPHAYATVKKPVTAPRLVEVLNLAEGLINRLRGKREGLNTVPLLEQMDKQARLAPSTLDTRLRTALRAATFRLLQAPIAATVLDDGRESLFTLLPDVGYSTRLTPTEFACVFAGNPAVVLLELDTDEQQALRHARQFHPMRELEWTFWISARSPWLRTELNEQDLYRLRRWPDFGRLPHHQSDIRMASFLMSQSLTLKQLQEHAGVRPENAMNFLNATFALGALVPAQTLAAQAAAPKPAPTPAAPRGLAAIMQQLRRKFGLTQTS